MKTITKLTVELVPRPLWKMNLRNRMRRSDWDRLRKKVYAEFGYRCGICGSKGRMNCHEIWEYDDQRHIQKLVSLIALCDLCHHIKHLGRAHLLVYEGRLDRGVLEKHFVKVNKCDLADYEKYKRIVFDQYNERSNHKWTVDYGDYRKLLPGI